MINNNLYSLRKINDMSQEDVAEKIGVSRQAVAKWEAGVTTPDIVNCIALAELFGVSLDDLVNYSQDKKGLPIPPRGKHVFGLVTLGEKGQLVIPKKARNIFDLNPGDKIVVLGDESQGLALAKADALLELYELLKMECDDDN